jgi:anti-sigma B factor antagonist
MSVNVETHKRVAVVTVKGRVDSSNAGEFDKKLQDLINEGSANIILDMGEVEYMSSAGLRAVVSALREAKKKRGDVRLAAPSARVAEVFELAGLRPLFTTYDNLTTAVGSF